nr:hypothetical protein [Nonomuraea terrae]
MHRPGGGREHLLAYLLGRWRSSWLISDSDAPARRIAVAAAWRNWCALAGSSPARRQARFTAWPTADDVTGLYGARARRNSIPLAASCRRT